MSATKGDRDRRAIPRWRDSHQHDASSEFVAPISRGFPQPVVANDDVLQERVRDWNAHRGIFYATDLIGAAFVFNRPQVATDAAKFLLKHTDEVPAPALRLAKILLGAKSEDTLSQEEEPGVLPSTEASRVAVRQLRHSLLRDPRNALFRVDLARQYANLGLRKHAEQQMRLALSLFPNTRFILRAATRLYVHLDDPEKAHNLLNQSVRTVKDPWLLASEIATSTLLKRTSRLLKQGIGMIEAKTYSPRHLSELASAIGTVDLQAGKVKACRQMLKVALIDPNDNSVAQVEWIHQKLGDPGLSQKYLSIPRSYEARALEGDAAGKWDETLKNSALWLADEPYSSRPAILGSFAASVGLEDFEGAIRLARFGLHANPRELALQTNLIFALISSGRFDDARSELSAIQLANLNDEETAPWHANTGLLAFREGNPSLGRNKYEEALRAATAAKNKELAAFVMAFWAREEARIGNELAKELLSVLQKAPFYQTSAGIRTIVDSVKVLLSSKHTSRHLK